MKQEVKFRDFEDLWRGASVTIPVRIRKLDLTPLDLTNYKFFFTMKRYEWDWDYDDTRAEVHREIEILEPETGRFFIQLSSDDTFHEPGNYYFDIIMTRDGAVSRIAAFKCKIIGGVGNSQVNKSFNPIMLTDEVTVNFSEQFTPIVITAPLVADPPENLIETIQTSPEYLLEKLDKEEKPTRNIKLHCYAPRISFAMNFTDLHDGQEHSYFFEHYSFPNLPEDCPLHNGAIKIRDREILFDMNGVEMNMTVYDLYVQSSPEIVVDGHQLTQSSLISYYVGDNVKHGTLNIMLNMDNQEYLHVVGNYVMPDDQGDHSHWMLRIDYFNWKN